MLLLDTLSSIGIVDNVREMRNGIEDTQPLVVTTPPPSMCLDPVVGSKANKQ